MNIQTLYYMDSIHAIAELPDELIKGDQMRQFIEEFKYLRKHKQFNTYNKVCLDICYSIYGIDNILTYNINARQVQYLLIKHFKQTGKFYKYNGKVDYLKESISEELYTSILYELDDKDRDNLIECNLDRFVRLSAKLDNKHLIVDLFVKYLIMVENEAKTRHYENFKKITMILVEKSLLSSCLDKLNDEQLHLFIKYNICAFEYNVVYDMFELVNRDKVKEYLKVMYSSRLFYYNFAYRNKNIYNSSMYLIMKYSDEELLNSLNNYNIDGDKLKIIDKDILKMYLTYLCNTDKQKTKNYCMEFLKLEMVEMITFCIKTTDSRMLEYIINTILDHENSIESIYYSKKYEYSHMSSYLKEFSVLLTHFDELCSPYVSIEYLVKKVLDYTYNILLNYYNSNRDNFNVFELFKKCIFMSRFLKHVEKNEVVYNWMCKNDNFDNLVFLLVSEISYESSDFNVYLRDICHCLFLKGLKPDIDIYKDLEYNFDYDIECPEMFRDPCVNDIKETLKTYFAESEDENSDDE